MEKIKELINSVDDVNFRFSDYFRDHGVIRFNTDDTLPLDTMVNIYSMTILLDLFIVIIMIDFICKFIQQIAYTCKATNAVDIYKTC